MFLLGSLLLVVQGVDPHIVDFLVFLADVFLVLEEGFFVFFGQSYGHPRAPLDIVDAFLEGVFGDDFSDEVPDLVAFFGAEEDEPSRGV